MEIKSLDINELQILVQQLSSRIDELEKNMVTFEEIKYDATQTHVFSWKLSNGMLINYCSIDFQEMSTKKWQTTTGYTTFQVPFIDTKYAIVCNSVDTRMNFMADGKATDRFTLAYKLDDTYSGTSGTPIVALEYIAIGKWK